MVVDFQPDKKMIESTSTNFQWQKAFSKGDQQLKAKKQTVSLEQDFTHQAEQVEIKIEAIEVVLFKICQRISVVGHESQILPHLHEVLVLCSSCFEKVNTEAARIGLLKRKLHLPQAEQF